MRQPSQSILEATIGVGASSASPGSAKIPGRGSVVLQRRRNNPLQKPIGWNFAPTDSLDPKIHSKHAKRQNIALEISATENSYVVTLKHMYEAFAIPCQLFLPTSDIATMFGNLNEILALHQEFAKAISERVNHWNYSTTISDVFAAYIPKMSIYSQYINVFDKGVSLINELSQNKASRFSDLMNVFAELPSSHGLDMPAYRINPVQRLPRLCLLLEDLLRNTIEHHPDYSGTRDALAQLKQVSLAVNAAKGASLLHERFESIAQRLSGWNLGTAKACKTAFLNDARRLVIEDTPMTLYGSSRIVPVSVALFSDGILVARRASSDDSKSSKEAKGTLEFMDWFPLRDARLRKIGTTQVSKISKEWSSNPAGTNPASSTGSSKSGASLEGGVSVYHWLELQVDEKETFLLGVAELKPYHDWPKKFRETLDELRSKYWSVISQGSVGRGEVTTANSTHPNSPPPCAYGTLTYVSRSSSFVYFGGISNKLLNSFYTYDVRTRQWMTIWPTGGPPPALAKHSACLVGSKIWYYGGLIKNTVTVSNDFYTYDTATNIWEGPLSTSGSGPTRGRAGHTMTWLGANSTKLYLLGGATFDDKKQEVILDDMFEFDTATLKWTQLNSAPIARHGHVAAALEGKLYAWGGRSPTGGPSSSTSSSANLAGPGSSPSIGNALNSTVNSNAGGSSPPTSLASGNSSSNLISSAAPSASASTPSSGSRATTSTEFSSVVSVYDFAVRDWTEALNLTGFVPASRQWAASSPVQGRHLLVFGGKRDALQNDMYLLDVNAETWCRYSLPCVLDHRMSSSMQVVEKNGILTVYLFGGLQLNPETMDTTSYSDSFVTFQLHNKYIQQTPKQATWTALRSYSVEHAQKGAQTGQVTSAASTASFNFISKVAQPTTATVARTGSVSTLCTLQSQLSTDSKFGETWMAVHSRTHLPFAAKVLKKSQGTADEWKAVGKAVEAAQKTKSQYLTTTLGLMDQGSSDTTWILTEYCKHGSVKDYLASGNKLREPQLQYLAFVIVSALQALHSSGLSHGNLKSSNILLNDALEFKIADYAVTGALETALKIEPTSAPASLRQDLAALSTAIIEMAEFSPPFKSLRKKWSSPMEDFVLRASMTDPEKVLTDLEAALNHPWLKNAKMSEKLQLELADSIKKSFAKESKKRASLALANVPTSNAHPAPPSPERQGPGSPLPSGKLKKEKSISASDTTDASTTGDDNGEGDSDEVVSLKQKNAVLRKKLRLLKRAYEELKTENAQLKDQIDPAGANEGTDGENSEADTVERSGSNPSSIKVKRASKPGKERPSSRKLKVSDGTATPAKEE